MSFYDLVTNANTPVNNSQHDRGLVGSFNPRICANALSDSMLNQGSEDNADIDVELFAIFNDDYDNSGGDSDKALLDTFGLSKHADEVSKAASINKDANIDEAIAEALKQMSAPKIPENLKRKHLNTDDKCANPVAYSCDICHTEFGRADCFQQHLRSIKHQTAVQNSGLATQYAAIPIANNRRLYECVSCNFTTRRSGAFNVHLDTANHKLKHLSVDEYLNTEKHLNTEEYLNTDSKRAKHIAYSKMAPFKLPESTTYRCDACHTTSSRASFFRLHLSSAKHQTAIQTCGLTNQYADIPTADNCQIYKCVLCDYATHRRDTFRAHLGTAKHWHNVAQNGC